MDSAGFCCERKFNHGDLHTLCGASKNHLVAVYPNTDKAARAVVAQWDPSYTTWLYWIWVMCVVAHCLGISGAKNHCIRASICTEIACSLEPDDSNKIMFGGRYSLASGSVVELSTFNALRE